MISKANNTEKIRRNSTEKSTKENEITEGMNAISSRKITSRQTTVRNFRTNLKSENDDSKTLISNNIEIETLWGEEDESIIQALVDRCKLLEGDQMQVKLEYYYKSLGIETDSIPVQPMKFDSEAPKTLTHQELEIFYKMKAKENWGRLTKAITCKDIKSFRTLINSVNSYNDLAQFKILFINKKIKVEKILIKNFLNW